MAADYAQRPLSDHDTAQKSWQVSLTGWWLSLLSGAEVRLRQRWVEAPKRKGGGSTMSISGIKPCDMAGISSRGRQAS